MIASGDKKRLTLLSHRWRYDCLVAGLLMQGKLAILWVLTLWISNLQTSCHRQLDKPMAMRLPAVMLQVSLSGRGFLADASRRAKQMFTAMVVIIL